MFLFYVLSFFKKGDTNQGRTLFKGGHYLRKYGILLGKKMPYPTAKHSMVGMGMVALHGKGMFGKVVSIGGVQKGYPGAPPLTLFEMTCVRQKCSWSSMKQNLNQSRHSFTSFLIPDNFVSCQSNNMHALHSSDKTDEDSSWTWDWQTPIFAKIQGQKADEGQQRPAKSKTSKKNINKCE